MNLAANSRHVRIAIFDLVLFISSSVWAQTRPIAIVGGMLIDGTGRAAGGRRRRCLFITGAFRRSASAARL